MAEALDVDIDQLPLAGAAPEWYSEKAVSIAFFVMAAGMNTYLGVAPPILGSAAVVKLATEGLKEHFGAAFVVEPDPFKCAEAIIADINEKRKALGLPV